MTVNYANKAASAKRMLDRFGSFGHVKLNRPSGATDPITGGTITTESFSLTAVDLAVGSDLIADGLVESTDRMVITSSDVKPLMNDTVLIGSTNHKIISIINVSPAGVDVIYKIICRA